jgi:DNA-binding NarL/FixJ family response regulator
LGLRAIIIEDDAELASVLERELSTSSIVVVANCRSGEDAVDAIAREAVDVALVDLGLPGMSGAATIRALRERQSDLAVLVLSSAESPDLIVSAIEAGAGGYLLKGTPLPEIVRAVEQVRQGLCPVSPAIARHLLATVRARATPQRDFALTERESEVLGLLVAGHSYADIGTALGIQLGTVQSHVKSIYRKLEVSSKAEAVRVALTEGAIR